MEKAEFKFEPIWVTVLGLLALFILYKFITAIGPDAGFNSLTAMGIVFMLPVALLLLPMSIKMFFGVPALRFTENQLIDNVLGMKIDWENIKDIRISGVRKPFIAIVFKSRDGFFQSISNPVKRLFIRLLAVISPGEFSINLAMVAGDNEAILAVTQVYWNRHFGREE